MTLPERLRERTKYVGFATSALLNEAADRIEELESGLWQMREVLERPPKEKK